MMCDKIYVKTKRHVDKSVFNERLTLILMCNIWWAANNASTTNV
jgi:hypothetical protein